MTSVQPRRHTSWHWMLSCQRRATEFVGADLLLADDLVRSELFQRECLFTCDTSNFVLVKHFDDERWWLAVVAALVVADIAFALALSWLSFFLELFLEAIITKKLSTVRVGTLHWSVYDFYKSESWVSRYVKFDDQNLLWQIPQRKSSFSWSSGGCSRRRISMPSFSCSLTRAILFSLRLFCKTWPRDLRKSLLAFHWEGDCWPEKQDCPGFVLLICIN